MSIDEIDLKYVILRLTDSYLMCRINECNEIDLNILIRLFDRLLCDVQDR